MKCSGDIAPRNRHTRFGSGTEVYPVSRSVIEGNDLPSPPTQHRFRDRAACRKVFGKQLAAASIVGCVMLFYHPHRWQAWIGVVFWIAAAAVLIDSVRTLLGLRIVRHNSRAPAGDPSKHGGKKS